MKDHLIIEAMKSHGGGFVRALADAAVRADAENLARLKAAFPEIWKLYEGMAAYAQDRRARTEGGVK